MDILSEDSALMLDDESWRIYSRHEPRSPQYIGAEAIIENSYITEGGNIRGSVKNSVLGAGVKVERGAEVCDSVIFDNVVIKEGAKVNYAILDSSVVVGKGARVGVPKKASQGITVVGSRVSVDDGANIADKKMISGVKEERK